MAWLTRVCSHNPSYPPVNELRGGLMTARDFSVVVTQTERCTTKQVRQRRAFFVRVGSTKPEVLIGDYQYNEHGY